MTGAGAGGPPGGASALSSVFTLLNSAVGAGVLSLPFAFRAAGWAGCLIATAAVASLEGFTLYVLARYAEVTGSRTYSDLVRSLLGRKASAGMSCVLIVYCYGSATAYLVILGDCAQPMLAQAFGQVWWTDRHFVIFAMATAFMLPLCFPRTLDAISGFSSITFYALCFVVGSVVTRSVEAVQAPEYDWGKLTAFSPLIDSIDALPILAFGFQCHSNVVAVFAELEEEPDLLLSSTANLVGGLVAGAMSASSSMTALDKAGEADGEAGGSDVAAAPASPPQRGPSAAAAAAAGAQLPQERVLLLRNPRRRFVQPARRTLKLAGMVQVVGVSLGLTACFYSLVGLFGYLNFPRDAHSNILLNYSTKDRLMQVARALVGVIQILHYPVNHAPARNATRDLLKQLTGRPLQGATFNVAEVLFFFCTTLGLSLMVTDLGSVFKLTGGTCGAVFIFAMPGAFCLQYSWSKHVQQREALEQPLLEGGEGGAAGEQARRAEPTYHVLLSKLFWAGVALMLLGLGLVAMTVYTLVAPPV